MLSIGLYIFFFATQFSPELTEEINNDMIEKLIKQVFTGGHTTYKDFLYHVNKNKPFNRNILKIKEPRRKIKALTKEEVEKVYKATPNINFLGLMYNTLYHLTDNREEWTKDVWDVRNLEKYCINYSKSITDYYVDFTKIDNLKIRATEIYNKI